MSEKYKNLAKNIGLFTICSFGQKILSFFLIPLYTKLLSTNQYGTIDLVFTGVSLAIPIITLCISDGMMRYLMDDATNECYIKKALNVYFKGYAVLLLVEIFVFLFVDLNINYSIYIWTFLLYISSSLNVLYSNYLRGVNKVKLMVTSNLISTSVILSLNVVFLVFLKMNINGYFLANIIGTFCGIIIVEYKEKLLLSYFKYPKLSKEKSKKLYSYSIPQILSAISWWVNSSLDRFFVTSYLGVSQNGIYSISYKIPNLLGIFERIFGQAWLVSCVSSYDKNDTDGFFGKTFELYSASMTIVCSIIMILNIPISSFLYSNEFFKAWICVPALLASTLFSTLNGFLGTIYFAEKKTKASSITTLASAVTNTVFNIILIPKYGILGAGIATFLGYFGIYVIRLVHTRKYIKMKVNYFKLITGNILIIIQMILATNKNSYIMQGVIVLLILLIFLKMYVGLIKKCICKITNKARSI